VPEIKRPVKPGEKSRQTARDKPDRRKPNPVAQKSIRWGMERSLRMERAAYLMSTRPPFREITMSDIARMAADEWVAAHMAELELTTREPCVTTWIMGNGYCATCAARFNGPGECPRTGKQVSA
jgi:hypothetical protein